MSESNHNKPERLIVYSNPNSSHAETIQGYIKSLEKKVRHIGAKVIRHETEPEQDAMNESWLANVDDGDIVAVASGDGGTASVLTAAMQTGQPVATLLGGNANDLAHMLHTNWALKKPLSIIRYGDIAQLTPIVVETRTPDAYLDSRNCFAYWGAGASAQAGAEFNIPEIRDNLNSLENKRFGFARRFANEGLIVNRVLHNAPTMTVSDAQGDRQIIDKSVVNGRRMAKSLRFPTRLLANEAGIVEVSQPTIRSMLSSLGKAALQMDKIHNGEGIRFTLDCDDADIITHIDGEDVRLPSGTEFSIFLADESVNVYTTRFAA